MTLRRAIRIIRRFGFWNYFRGCSVCLWPEEQCFCEGHLPETCWLFLQRCRLAKAFGEIAVSKQDGK